MNVTYVNDQKLSAKDGMDVPHSSSSSLPEKKVEQKRTNLLSSISPLAYPPDLTEKFYIEFNAFKHNTSRADELKRTFSFEKSVYLPFPSNVTDQYNASYNTENLFGMGEFARESLDSLMTADNGTKKVANLLDKKHVANRSGQILANAMNKLADNPAGAAAAASAFFLQGVGGPIASAAKTELQVATNPYQVLIFQGLAGFKEFGFSWTFFPESPDESETIRKIIGYFRREMLPEKIDGHPSILKYPAIFEVYIHPEVKMFKRCVVKSVDVNYTPMGPAFVKEFPVKTSSDINPAAVTLTIHFQEMEAWLANDFYAEESKNFDYNNPRADRQY